MKNFVLPILLLIFFGLSCKKNSQTANGQLMIVNASPDAGSLNITLNGNVFGTGTITYPGNSGYQSLPEGAYRLRAEVAGVPLFDGNLTTGANNNQSIFFYDRVVSLKAMAVVDNISTPVAGKANVRFFNLSASSPVIDAGMLIGGSFTPWFPLRAFEDNVSAITHAGFQSFDAGTYTFQIRVNGAGTVLLNFPGLMLEAGKSYTLFSKGISGDAVKPLGVELIVNN